MDTLPGAISLRASDNAVKAKTRRPLAGSDAVFSKALPAACPHGVVEIGFEGIPLKHFTQEEKWPPQCSRLPEKSPSGQKEAKAFRPDQIRPIDV
jgi:hypothetical protein